MFDVNFPLPTSRIQHIYEQVIIFSAPSGSGKTTLVKYCLGVFPELQFSISATTRALRGEEIHGKDCFFSFGRRI